jgi:hypothetical protein
MFQQFAKREEKYQIVREFLLHYVIWCEKFFNLKAKFEFKKFVESRKLE